MPQVSVAAIDGYILGRNPREKAREALALQAQAPNPSIPFVVGAALPRTGSTSLTRALTILGYGYCYHLSECNEMQHLEAWDPPDADYDAGIYPSLPDFRQLLDGFRSGVDVPFCIWWKQIYDLHPGSKVILTMHPRGPRGWYKSCCKTIRRLGPFPLADVTTPWGRRLAYTFVPVLRRLWDWETRSHWKPWNFETEEGAARYWEKYSADVKEYVPEQDLLEYCVVEGWEPLCKFLNVPIPDVPFPFENSYERQMEFAQTVDNWGWAMLLIHIVLFSIISFMSYQCGGPETLLCTMAAFVSWITYVVVHGYPYNVPPKFPFLRNQHHTSSTSKSFVGTTSYDDFKQA